MDFNDSATGRMLVDSIQQAGEEAGPTQIMEVCGTHTMSIGRFGIRKVLPENIRLISGPGCPVCVTPAGYIDHAVTVALSRGVTIATFGDMVRVPGTHTSLEEARARGARIQVVTSPMEILQLKGEVLFLAVGFETTAAPIAATMELVALQERRDIFFYTSIKLIPPTLQQLLADQELNIDGFILPGHVSTIIGSKAYDFLTVPSVIAGFEMLDILGAILKILEMKVSGSAGTVNAYTRAVTSDGNPRAMNLIRKYMVPGDQLWRGLGALPGCSLVLRKEYSFLDAEKAYSLPPVEDAMPEGCSCGEVLTGKITPAGCPIFATRCTPEYPVGPCMVSSEGSCAAYYQYDRECA